MYAQQAFPRSRKLVFVWMCVCVYDLFPNGIIKSRSRPRLWPSKSRPRLDRFLSFVSSKSTELRYPYHNSEEENWIDAAAAI